MYEDSAALSRHLRSQGYTTRTVRRTGEAYSVTAARRHEGDLMRAAIYPLSEGVYCAKIMNRAVHSKLGSMLPVVVHTRHLSGTLATPERIEQALL